MIKDLGITLVHQFFPGTGASYDHMVNLCTFGFDRLWKGRIMEQIPLDSRRIMDQACGTGILTCKIAKKFPQSEIIGVDVTDEYLTIARQKIEQLQLTNVTFISGRAEDVVLENGFDCITSSYLAKYAEIDRLTSNARKMLHPGGVLIMHDFTYPRNRVCAFVWESYFRVLRSFGAWKYPLWRNIFHGLPVLLRETQWVTQLQVSLQKNFFSHVSEQHLTFGTSAIVRAKKI
jgi:demethylmenaquinone methyltransferase/2-methoxy-6-polyprenyl-1,4-benzoquinol methylase